MEGARGATDPAGASGVKRPSPSAAEVGRGKPREVPSGPSGVKRPSPSDVEDAEVNSAEVHLSTPLPRSETCGLFRVLLCALSRQGFCLGI